MMSDRGVEPVVTEAVSWVTHSFLLLIDYCVARIIFDDSARTIFDYCALLELSLCKALQKIRWSITLLDFCESSACLNIVNKEDPAEVLDQLGDKEEGTVDKLKRPQYNLNEGGGGPFALGISDPRESLLAH